MCGTNPPHPPLFCPDDDPKTHKRRRPVRPRRLSSKRLIRRDLPRSPSLELSVLPNGGGQYSPCESYARLATHVYGAEGDRTPDLCSAIAALSQLSYSPARRRYDDRCIDTSRRALNASGPTLG